MQTLTEIYTTNENNNNHIENARIIVMAFGTEKELNIIERIIARKNENAGYSPNLYNTIMKTALKYEAERLNQGNDIFIVDGKII